MLFITGAPACPGGTTPVTMFTPRGGSVTYTATFNVASALTSRGVPTSSGGNTPVYVHTPPTQEGFITTTVPGGAKPSVATGSPAYLAGPIVTIVRPAISMTASLSNGSI